MTDTRQDECTCTRGTQHTICVEPVFTDGLCAYCTVHHLEQGSST